LALALCAAAMAPAATPKAWRAYQINKQTRTARMADVERS